MTPQVVIETATGRVLRGGYTDFANDGQFDSLTETVVITAEYHRSLNLDEVDTNGDQFWNISSGEFQDTPP